MNTNLKQNGLVFNTVCFIEDILFKLFTIISPKLNTTLRYFQASGKWPNYREPKTFTEKLITLKLKKYIHNPLVIKCADKYAVREYISNCGYDYILNDLIGVYNDATEIPWNELPQKFVLKWNFGAGMNIICKEKDYLDITETIKQLNRWGKRKYWLTHAEMQYKYAPKRIICERFLQTPDNTSIPDYKVYCFNGKPLAILVMHDRGNGVKTEFFDQFWNPLANTKKYSSPKNPTPKPSCLNELLKCAEALSKPFPFVRLDFYIIDNRIIFGEMTFTPAGGVLTSQTMIDGKEMGEYLTI